MIYNTTDYDFVVNAACLWNGCIHFEEGIVYGNTYLLSCDLQTLSFSKLERPPSDFTMLISQGCLSLLRTSLYGFCISRPDRSGAWMEVIKVNSLFLLSINDRSEEMEEEASSDEFEHWEDLETSNPNDFIVPCPRKLPLLPTVFGHGILMSLSGNGYKLMPWKLQQASGGSFATNSMKLMTWGKASGSSTDSVGFVIFGVMISQVKSKPAKYNNLNTIQTQK